MDRPHMPWRTASLFFAGGRHLCVVGTRSDGPLCPPHVSREFRSFSFLMGFLHACSSQFLICRPLRCNLLSRHHNFIVEQTTMASFTGSNLQQNWQQNNQTTKNQYTMNTSSRDGVSHEHHNSSINRNRNNNIDMNSEFWRLVHHNFASDSQQQPSQNQNQNQMNTFSVGTSSTSDQLAQAQLMMAQYQQQLITNNPSSSSGPSGANITTTSNSGNANSSNSNSNSSAMQPQSNDGMLAMLGSKVEPFQPRSSSLDDDADLWKVFDDELTPKPLNPGSSYALLNSSQHPIHSEPSHNARASSMYTTRDSNNDYGNNNKRTLENLQPRNDRPDHQIEIESQEDHSDPFDLPSTMIPPSVLAFRSQGKKKHPPFNHDGESLPKRFKAIEPTISPQKFLEEMLASRGHAYNRIKADEAEYDAVPSALQLSSFGTKLVKAVHTSDTDTLHQLLACGLSPNPCNQFRDGMLDLVCKRSNKVIFDVLIQHGADLQVVDGFGRTPLHHCCWSSEFCAPIVDSLLQRDPIQLCIEDKHGQTALEYVRADLYGDWIHYLSQNIHRFFDPAPPMLSSPKARRPEGTLVNPQNSIGVSLAALLSSGSLTPAQVAQMDEKTRQEYKAKGKPSTR